MITRESIILRCDCESEYQDNEYGEYLRVHNPLLRHNEYKCTACGQTKCFELPNFE